MLSLPLIFLFSALVAALPLTERDLDCSTAGFKKKMLTNLNAHRSNHSAPLFTWNQTLASAAQVLTDRCVFAHDTTIMGGGYGQNLYAGPTGDPGNAVNDWYNDEIECYPSDAYGMDWTDWPASPCDPNGSGFWDYGHFTQVVWVDSLTVGCAVTECDVDFPGEVYIACNFFPPGNYVDELNANVLVPEGQDVIVDICAPAAT